MFDVKQHLPKIQQVILKEMMHEGSSIFSVCRGGGKTFMLALYSAMATADSAVNVGILSPSTRQTNMVFRDIERINKWVRPTNTAALIEKFDSTNNYDVVLIDEGVHVPEEKFELANRLSNKTITMTSGHWKHNYLWKRISYSDYSYNFRQVPYWLFPDGFFDFANLMEIKRVRPKYEFRFEYCGEFIDSKEYDNGS